METARCPEAECREIWNSDNRDALVVEGIRILGRTRSKDGSIVAESNGVVFRYTVCVAFGN
jgi:hypothetical protein